MKYIGAGEFEDLGYVDAENIFPKHPTEDDCRGFMWVLPEIGPDADHCDALADWDEFCDYLANKEIDDDCERMTGLEYVDEALEFFGWHWAFPVAKA